MTRLLAMLAVMLAVAGSALAADQTHWSRLAAAIAAEIAEAEAKALAGQADESKKAVTAAYFGGFETSKMEAALRKELGAKYAFAREKQFGDLRKLVSKGAPDEIRLLAAALRAGLLEDGKALDAARISPDVFAVNQ
jgi:high-affinity iron transporter